MRVRSVPDPASPDPGLIAEAVAVLRRGGLVAFPTDTVYGVGALPAHQDRLFTAKVRPRDKQIPWLIAGVAQAPVPLPDAARRLADRYWPGPLTLVVPCGHDTIGLRAPDHPLAQAILLALGEPLAVTSANRSGAPPACTAAAAARMLAGRVDLVLDGGPAPGKTASTVVRIDPDGITLLREGAIPWADLCVPGLTPPIGPCWSCPHGVHWRSSYHLTSSSENDRVGKAGR